jgi:hypothetical protein
VVSATLGLSTRPGTGWREGGREVAPRSCQDLHRSTPFSFPNTCKQREGDATVLGDQREGRGLVWSRIRFGVSKRIG